MAIIIILVLSTKSILERLLHKQIDVLTSKNQELHECTITLSHDNRDLLLRDLEIRIAMQI